MPAGTVPVSHGLARCNSGPAPYRLGRQQRRSAARLAMNPGTARPDTESGRVADRPGRLLADRPAPARPGRPQGSRNTLPTPVESGQWPAPVLRPRATSPPLFAGSAPDSWHSWRLLGSPHSPPGRGHMRPAARAARTSFPASRLAPRGVGPANLAPPTVSRPAPPRRDAHRRRPCASAHRARRHHPKSDSDQRYRWPPAILPAPHRLRPAIPRPGLAPPGARCL